ncbi:MAG: hypothetical protein ACK56I_09510, partial [bacterium]
ALDDGWHAEGLAKAISSSSLQIAAADRLGSLNRNVSRMQVGQKNAVAFQLTHHLLHLRPTILKLFHAIHLPGFPGLLMEIEGLVEQSPGKVEKVRRPDDGHFHR